MLKEIGSMKEFYDIVDNQKAVVATTINHIQRLVEDIKKRKKEYTIFSLIDDEGEKYYICYGIKRVNNIGYYVLEGEYTLKDKTLCE